MKRRQNYETVLARLFQKSPSPAIWGAVQGFSVAESETKVLRSVSWTMQPLRYGMNAASASI